MYVPSHFAMTPEQVGAVLSSAAAGDLVTAGRHGLEATYVPMLHDPDTGGFGSLLGHLSLVNGQWRSAAEDGGCEALFVLHGPGDYIESGWLSTPGAPSVPTWNYVTVHVHGRLLLHRDPEWMLSCVRRLSAAHGDASLDSRSPADIEKLLRAIVGVELRISRVEGKAKMSQNRTPEVVGQVIEGLRAAGGDETADWMAAHSLPRASAKADLLAGIRATRTPAS